MKRTIFIDKRRTIAGLSTAGLVALGMLVPSLMRSFAQQPAVKLAKYTETLPNSVVKIQMLPIPGGSIKIGKAMVKVKPFYIASTETVWEAFDVFIASGEPTKNYDQTKYAPDAIARPSRSYILPDLGWGHNGNPAINLSSDNVEMFCRWLSKETKKKYRVPTEAEWEFACRAGDMGPMKMTSALLESNSWYERNSKEKTHPVGKKLPNKFGLYDMLGNVGEWCTDLAGKPVVCGPSFADPAAKVSPTTRSRWNADWQDSDPQMPKSRWWLSDAPFAGFRVVCEP